MLLSAGQLLLGFLLPSALALCDPPPVPYTRTQDLDLTFVWSFATGAYEFSKSGYETYCSPGTFLCDVSSTGGQDDPLALLPGFCRAGPNNSTLLEFSGGQVSGCPRTSTALYVYCRAGTTVQSTIEMTNRDPCNPVLVAYSWLACPA